MSYSKYRQHYPLPLAPTRANNAVLASFSIPAGKSVTVFDMKVYMSTAGDASTTLELVFDGGSPSAEVVTSASGKATAGLTAPLTFTGVAAGTSRLQVLQNTQDTAGIGTLVLDMEMPLSNAA